MATLGAFEDTDLAHIFSCGVAAANLLLLIRPHMRSAVKKLVVMFGSEEVPGDNVQSRAEPKESNEEETNSVKKKLARKSSEGANTEARKSGRERKQTSFLSATVGYTEALNAVVSLKELSDTKQQEQSPSKKRKRTAIKSPETAFPKVRKSKQSSTAHDSEQKQNKVQKQKAEPVSYEEGEIALAEQACCIYEVKIMKKNLDHKGREGYHLHYQGWSKKFDEWVAPDRMMKKNPANLKRMKELNAVVKQAIKNGETPHLKLHSNAESQEEQQARKEIPLKLPYKLEERLVKDYLRVGEETILPLPRKPSVNSIFEQYLTKCLDDITENLLPKHKKRRKKSKKRGKPSADAMAESKDQVVEKSVEQLAVESFEFRIIEETVCGLKTYFEHSLPTSLLYTIEMIQFQDLSSTTNLCDVYGCEHLLRLFVKLPLFLASTTIDPKQRSVFLAKIGDFLKWLEWQSDMFANDYQEVEPAYARRICGLLAGDLL